MRKSGRYYLSEVVYVNITKSWKKLNIAQGVVKELFCGVPAENSQLESSNKETLNTNEETFYKIGLKSSKLSVPWESKKVWGILPDCSKTNVMRLENEVQYEIPGWILLPEWTLLGYLEKDRYGLWSRWWYHIGVNSWILMTKTVALQENALFIEITHE